MRACGVLQGRISALQLEYGDAYEKLKSSLRKAPQHLSVAPFRRTVQKLMVIVSLLMGEVRNFPPV